MRKLQITTLFLITIFLAISCKKGANSVRELCIQLLKNMGDEKKFEKLILDKDMIVNHYKENLSIEFGGTEKAEAEGIKQADKLLVKLKEEHQELYKTLQSKGFDMKKLEASDFNLKVKGKNNTYQTVDAEFTVSDLNHKETISFQALEYKKHWFIFQDLKLKN